jgi:purine-nucleoside phosphorylase
MRVLALSLITNKVVDEPYRSAKGEVEAELGGQQISPPDTAPVADHLEVLEVGQRAANDVRAVVEKVVELAARQA